MLGAELDRERRHGDRVLEQAAQVGVVAAARARRAAQRGAQGGVAEDVVQERPEGRVADLAGEVLEEAVELVEVAEGDGQERGRVGLAGVGAGDRPQLGLELVAEALHPAGHADEVAALEAAGQDVGVPEDPRRQRARPVAQLEREVRASRTA